MKKISTLFTIAGIAILFSACVKNIDHPGQSAGAVYTLSNQVSGNFVISFKRDAHGVLTPGATVSTGGTGTSAALGSQGALSFSPNHHWLFAVNAGSNDISAFKVSMNALTLTGRIASGGTMPVSIANYGNLVYVLNGGAGGSIAGFYLQPDGSLTAVANSFRQLSGEVTGPAQIAFVNNGTALVITEKAASKIVTYHLSSDGIPGTEHALSSASPTPFGFAVDMKGNLFVSEASQGALSVYHVNSSAMTSLVDGPVFTHQNAACWVVLTNDGKYAYVANAASNSISGYRVNSSGKIQLLNPNGITGETGAGSKPIDEAISNNSKFLYVLNSGSQAIRAFEVNADGSLDLIGDKYGLAMGVSGLAAE